MYIKSYFKYSSSHKDEKEYRKLLKELLTINIRRVSKLNLLSIYGAMSCLKDVDYDRSLSIYTASEYACIEDIHKVIKDLKEDFPIMPFDFLNINTNNTGFFISKAINSTGENSTISSNKLSFEKAFELAYFDYLNKTSSSFLLGNCDSSLINTLNYEEVFPQDVSSWLYIDDKKDASIAKVDLVKSFKNTDELNSYLKNIDYDVVSFNKIALENIEKLNIDKALILYPTIESYILSSAGNIIELLNLNKEKSIYISLDNKQRAYLFCFNKN